MASPLLLSGKKRTGLAGIVDFQRVSKPQLSLLILVATAFVVALVLLVWLLLWITRTTIGVEGWWIAQRGLTAPALGFQADDVRRVVGSRVRAPADVADRSFEQALRARLSRAGRRPVVVFLSAAGVADDQGAFLLRPEGGSLNAFGTETARVGLVTPDRLLEAFAASPSGKKLLILDASQVGSDRNLGVFANAFVAHLKKRLEANPVRGLLVLSAAAPGQVSWASEADRGSVFAHYVAQGLSGAASGWDPEARGLTARGLERYVRHHVSRWASAHRQAEQTPLLLGDPKLNFPLPHTNPARATATARDPKEAEKLLARLDEAWTRRDALQARQPYRHTPLQWRRYLETLLRAERLYRFGEFGEAEEYLGQLPTLEKSIADAAGGLPFSPSWSLAMRRDDLTSRPSEAGTAAEKEASDRIEAALKDLTEKGEEDDQPIEKGPESETPTSNPGEPAAGIKGTTAATPAAPGAKPGEKPAAGEAPEELTKPTGPEGSPKVVSTKRKSGGSASSTRKAGTPPVSPLAALADPNDRGRPEYLEAQLLVWADTFLKRSGLPDAFGGVRGELLIDAVRVRRVAEEAAAADDRIARWVMPLVESGDELRRRAQDGLFGGTTGNVEALRELLETARSRDRQAVDVAERCLRAIDLLERIEAELPYYGEWKSRQSARHDEGLDPEFLALIAVGSRLARLLQSDPAGAASRRTANPPGEKNDTPDAAFERFKEMEEVYREAKEAFDRVAAEFQAQANTLATAGSAGRWREIDRLLAVPLIPADVRRGLLRRVQAVAAGGAFTGAEDGTSAAATTNAATETATDFQSYARQQTKKVVAGTPRPRRGEGDDLAGAGSDVPVSADPDFWNHGLALARLDWGLLELGGAEDADLGRIESAFLTARNAARGESEGVFEAFERLSRVIRAVRASRSQSIQQTRAATFAPLAAADRAVRVLPLSEAPGGADKATEVLDRFLRQSLLVWHGRRLCRDFAPEHALRVLENARDLIETDELREVHEEASAMSLARIGIAAKAEGNLVIDEWTEKPLFVDLTTSGRIPSGEAVALLGFDATRPLALTVKATRQEARQGVLVPLIADARPPSLEYVAMRTESTPEPVTVPVSPGVFYRGRYFAADRAIDVTVDPARDPVTVTIQQSYEGLAFKDFTDQFKEHPGQGYLHFGTNLKYKLVLTGDRPLKLWVRYGLKEHPESYQTKMVEVSPKRRGEIIDVVRGNDFQIVKTDNNLLDIAPLTLQVTVFKDRDNGEVVGRGRYPFKMIPPPQYIAVSANFEPATRLLYLDVVHLANDPVTGPVKVYASIGGQEGWAWIRRSRFVTFAIPVPPSLKTVTWRVGVESMPGAFREEIETPVPQGQEAKPPAL
jgi:hypothetical protein